MTEAQLKSAFNAAKKDVGRVRRGLLYVGVGVLVLAGAFVFHVVT